MSGARPPTACAWVLALGIAAAPTSARAQAPEGPRLAAYPGADASGGVGDVCTLDRHCGVGLGCYVPWQRCVEYAEIARRQQRDRRRDIAFVVPISIVGAGVLATGAVFAARGNAIVAGVAIPVGSLLTLVGIGGATAIGIKRRRHRERLREISSRLSAR